jgi:ADP-heptose:LPS heptosyltransferase
VRRRGAIGDVILTTGVVHRLKEKYPLSEITIQTNCQYVYSKNPDVHHIIDFSEKVSIESFDMVFDLDMSYESDPQNHIIDVYSKICGVSNEKDLFLYPDLEYEERIKKLFGNKKVAVFHCEPTPRWEGRELPIDKFKYAEEYLRKKGFSILEVGFKYRLKSDINYQDTNWDSLCSIIKYSKIFIGLDSGPFHIAQAFKIPSVVPFGMINPKYRVNNFSLVKPVVSEWVKCKGCHHWQEQPTIFSSKCLRDKYYCMILISNDDMKIAIDKMLEEVK